MAIFCGLLAVEVCIALFVHDAFVRPYVGDMLVTLLLCCMCRVILPDKIRLLPVFVFLFAACVEIGQYFDVVALMGLTDNRFLSIALVDDEDMMKTVESVRDFGVLTPAIVRPDPDGGYEIISGHRRHRASELAGKETMPVIFLCVVDI